MGRRITIRAGDAAVEAELNDSRTAAAIVAALPITAAAGTWGDEIYFSTPVKHELEPEYQSETVPMGAVGYWPAGDAVCLFFGPTPVSAPGEIRPASAVNVIGHIKGDPTVLKRVAPASPVELRLIDDPD